ncbi:hypothetical protein CMI47_17775 [Candidatus Pacearchaeota archaeon]|nr:hypothetical protein [Candidatus Pacearchaeota archaeon]|tara:strand:- start:643 stop:960 length:318 start_codon:yes stop_codon:yes gene_type:complete
MKFDLPQELLAVAHGTQLDKAILGLAANLVEREGAGAITKLRSRVIQVSEGTRQDTDLTLRQASNLVAAMEENEAETLDRAEKVGALIADALGKVGASLLRQLAG